MSAGTDPDSECLAQDVFTCGSNGDGCNGSFSEPACYQYSDNTECLPQTCDSRVQTEAGVCRRGVCEPSDNVVSCGAYQCDAEGDACLQECGSVDDCAQGYACTSGVCRPQGHYPTVEWSYLYNSNDDWEPLRTDISLFGVDSGGTTVFLSRCTAGYARDHSCEGAANVLQVDSAGLPAESETVAIGYAGNWASARGTMTRDGTFAIGSSITTNSSASSALSLWTADLTRLWSKYYVVDEERLASPSWVTIGDAGSVYIELVTPSWAPVDVGDGPRAGRVLVKYNAAGLFLWAADWAGMPRLYSDSAGGLVTYVNATNAQSLGCPAESDSGLYIAGLDGNLGCTWGRNLKASYDSASVQGDPQGYVYFSTTTRGDIDLGSGPVEPLYPDAEQLVFGRMLDGGVRWAQILSGPDFSGWAAVSVAANGSLLVTGGFSGTLEVGDTVLDSTLGSTYLLRYTQYGDLIGAAQFFGGGQAAIAPDGSVRLLSTGTNLDMGDGRVWGETADPGVAVMKLRL